MIVKNEEANLPRCLASLRGVVDEMVVVDTGSSDRTVEMAREAGAAVTFFPWNGSEADARNASVGAAKGRWLLMIDADEVMSAELAGELRPALEKLDGRAATNSLSVLFSQSLSAWRNGRDAAGADRAQPARLWLCRIDSSDLQLPRGDA